MSLTDLEPPYRITLFMVADLKISDQNNLGGLEQKIKFGGWGSSIVGGGGG